jgi:hypothetical protein
VDPFARFDENSRPSPKAMSPLGLVPPATDRPPAGVPLAFVGLMGVWEDSQGPASLEALRRLQHDPENRPEGRGRSPPEGEVADRHASTGPESLDGRPPSPPPGDSASQRSSSPKNPRAG